MSKDDLIAELKDTCKVLEATIKANTEKKMELERLIRRLSDKGIDDGEAAEEEEDAAEETESDTDDDSDATPWSPHVNFCFLLLLAIGACPFEQFLGIGL